VSPQTISWKCPPHESESFTPTLYAALPIYNEMYKINSSYLNPRGIGADGAPPAHAAGENIRGIQVVTALFHERDFRTSQSIRVGDVEGAVCADRVHAARASLLETHLRQDRVEARVVGDQMYGHDVRKSRVVHPRLDRVIQCVSGAGLYILVRVVDLHGYAARHPVVLFGQIREVAEGEPVHD